MREHRTRLGLLRTRWSAVGAAVAITLGAGGLSMAQAAIDTGDRPVTVSIAAERILDTRVNLGLAGRFADATPRDLQVTGSVPVASGGSKTVVPNDAIGVLVNVTVVTPSHEGFLSLRPEGAAGEPTTSTVNFFPGAIEPNAATVDLNNGKIQIWVETSSNSGSADVLIDVVGYTVDHTHDDRYYTEGEVDTAVAAAVAPKADLSTVTVLGYNGSNTEASPGSTYELIRTVGTFTKASADTAVRLDFSGHHTSSGAGFCHYQLRVDGRANDGDNALNYQGDQEGNAVSYATASPLATFVMFPGLTAGNHTVQIYVRGSSPSCTLNSGNFNQQVIVQEFPVTALSDLASVTAAPTEGAAEGGE